MSKYQIPIDDENTVKVTPAQFDAALNWADRTKSEPDRARYIHAVFPERDNWANGQRRCCTKLAEKGVLKGFPYGYVMSSQVREHLERYRYQ